MKEICNACIVFYCETSDDGDRMIYSDGEVYERHWDIEDCELKFNRDTSQIIKMGGEKNEEQEK